MTACDVIILGAGAAGLMCAISAGQRGRRVLLLDHADKIGAKILISGGGRCNFTNLGVVPERFLSNNPHFAKSALSRYTQHDFIALVDKHRIAWHEKTLGQLFCDGSAREIVRMLKEECDAAQVDIRTSCHIRAINKSASDYHVETSLGTFAAPALVVATGGPSIPKMGATGFAYDIARQFDIALTDVRPALVPVTAQASALEFCKSLAGVALDSIASIGKRTFRENMLFTHRGLSGPAILQISSYWQQGNSITLDLLPETHVENFLLERKKTRAKAELKTILSEILPQRFATVFAESRELTGPLANMTDAALRDIAAGLKNYSFTPAGSEGYAKAEVTAGGIDTNALSSKTMACKTVPGLYFIGEAVDVTGWLGGYNFQWAWSSGWVAGQSC
jgi:predicted Rossmann fold flavoprotein